MSEKNAAGPVVPAAAAPPAVKSGPSSGTKPSTPPAASASATLAGAAPSEHRREPADAPAASSSALDAGPADKRAFITDRVRAELRTVDLNMWEFSAEELVYLFEQMFIDLGFLAEFAIDRAVFISFMEVVRANYRDNPFHNFYHSFCVTHMTYCVLRVCREQAAPFLTTREQFALLFSAVTHDLDHPGANNAFQINSRSDLAVIYNDASCLENHHCSLAFQILARPACNIVQSFTVDEYKAFRKLVIACVLSTDMARHFEILAKFDKLDPVDMTNADHRFLLAQIILMCCDISNEVRPPEVSREWANRLTDEFGNQVDLEKELGLPFMPFMDRSQVVLEKSQIGFIAFLLRPLWVSAMRVLPALGSFVDRIDVNYQEWSVIVQRKATAEMLCRLKELDPTFAAQRLPAGTVICRTGDSSNELFIVAEGRVEVVDETMVNSLNVFEEGCFFGEIALLKNVRRTANVKATTECTIYVAPKDLVMRMIREYPAVEQSLSQVANIREGIIQRNVSKGLQSFGVELDLHELVHVGGG